MDRPSSLVPLIPRRSAEDFVHRLADLKVDADTQGYGTLSYFLDIAMREAMIQADRETHDRRAKDAPRTDLWSPEC